MSSLERALDCFVMDSVTHLPHIQPTAVVVAASHCGIWSARLALQFPMGAIVMNDAGVGKDQAGVAGLRILEDHAVPAATVSHLSARIGDGADCLEKGRISYCNCLAVDQGIVIGMAAKDAVEILKKCPSRKHLKQQIKPMFRRMLEIEGGGRKVTLVDSASLAAPEDANAVVVTGSHGGLLGHRPETAMNVDVFAALFNDAGIGKDHAGISRLAPLDARGIAAVTVDVWSARIGESKSTLEDGRLSHVNKAALKLGGKPRMPAYEFVRLAAQS